MADEIIIPIAIEKQPYDDPWRAYGYSSQIIVPGLDVFGDTLLLRGQGNNPVLTAFKLTTWTDHTFLCWYAGPYGDSVITNMVNFESVFENCTFPTAPGPSHDDCIASSPEACPLVCELSP